MRFRTSRYRWLRNWIMAEVDYGPEPGTTHVQLLLLLLLLLGQSDVIYLADAMIGRAQSTCHYRL